MKFKRLKPLIDVAVKHIYSNVVLYLKLIGALAHSDYSSAFDLLGAVALRVLIGAIMKHLKVRNKKDSDEKKNHQQ